jgi:hypothetical protein
MSIATSSYSSSLDLFSTWAIEHENKDLQDFASLSTLNRYLVAFDGNLERAKAGLEATIEWRSTSIIPTFVCIPCARNKGAHCFISLGEDKEGNALIYGCPARAGETNVEETMAHCIHSLEKQWPNNGAKKWVWIVDFKGFGLVHSLNARLGISFATVFKQHFPERLRAIALINPPFVFKALIAAISTFADVKTLNKLFQINATTSDEIVNKLHETFGLETETQQWLNIVFDDDDVTPDKLPPLPRNVLNLQV